MFERFDLCQEGFSHLGFVGNWPISLKSRAQYISRKKHSLREKQWQKDDGASVIRWSSMKMSRRGKEKRVRVKIKSQSKQNKNVQRA